MDEKREPRWLSDDEQRDWRAFVETTQLLVNRLDTDLHRDAGLSHADYEILVRLSEAEGLQLRMSELADQALFSRSRLSHAVTRLESAGLVRREACPGDRRGTLAVLSEVGAGRLRQAAGGHVETVRRYVIDVLPDTELTELGRISRRIRAALEAG